MILLVSLGLAGWMGVTRLWRLAHPTAGTARSDWAITLVVALCALAAYTPYFHRGYLGAGDSYHYHLQVADAITQVRQGRWPVLIGQSNFAFNGNPHTVRTAPYFVHGAAALDTITGRQLTATQLTHAVLLSTAVLAAWCALLAARAVSDGRVLIPGALAVLYVLSPALAGPLIAHDMVATFVAAPWHPLAWASMAWILRRPEAVRAWLGLGGSIGLLWLAHPPTALCLTPFAVLAAWIGLFRAPTRRTAVHAGFAVLLCAGIAGYVWYSVATLADPARSTFRNDSTAPILQHISTAAPGLWKPLDLAKGTSSPIQTGYALAAALLFGAVGLFRRPTRVSAGFLAASVGVLLVLITPVPGVTERLWSAVPNEITTILNAWPTQRLVPLIASAAVVLGGIGAAALPRPTALQRILVGTSLFVSLGWSVLQFAPLREAALRTRHSVQEIQTLFAPENVVLTRSSYALLETTPDSFSNGWMDVEFESRLLDRDFKPLPGNVEFALRARQDPSHVRSVPLGVTTELDVDAGRDHVLVFGFPEENVGGSVVLQGERLFREYALPSSGARDAFGSGPTHSHHLRLRAPRAGHYPLVVQAPAGTNVSAVAFNPAELPVRVSQLTPYTAEVKSPTPGYLETPTVWVPGYSAQVDGKPVEVAVSADGLVCVPVPDKPCHVVVSYPGPKGLRILGWVSTLCVGFLFVATFAASPPKGSAPLPAPEAPASRSPRRARAVLLSATVAALAVAGYFVRFRPPPAPAGGKIILEVQFPKRPPGGAEPLVQTGSTGRADVLYVVYSGPDTLRFGVDHWGVGGPVSGEVRYHPGKPYQIEYESPALRLDGQGGEGPVRIRFDDATVLDLAFKSHGASRSELHVGRNPAGSSSCSTRFSGRILVRP